MRNRMTRRPLHESTVEISSNHYDEVVESSQYRDLVQRVAKIAWETLPTEKGRLDCEEQDGGEKCIGVISYTIWERISLEDDWIMLVNSMTFYDLAYWDGKHKYDGDVYDTPYDYACDKLCIKVMEYIRKTYGFDMNRSYEEYQDFMNNSYSSKGSPVPSYYVEESYRKARRRKSRM